MIRPFTAILLMLMLLASGGCVLTTSSSDLKLTTPSPPYDTSAAHIIQKLAAVRVLFVGETHNRYDHHLIQLEALKAMYRQDPRLAIGVEWFQQPFQGALDDYIAGRIDERTLLKRSEYFQRWRFDYRLYRPILRYARAHHIPVIALNAPAELTNAIREQGLIDLPAALHAELPKHIDRGDSDYLDDLRLSFEQHPGADKRSFERFIDVQLTWDESMAQRAAAYLSAHPDSRMIIFAGIGHLQHGWGIPARLKRRSGLDYAILLPADEPLDEPGVADFIVLTKPKELPPAGLLGVFMEDTDDGVRIVHLTEHSGAADAGLDEGDIILAVDGHPVSTFTDIKLALMDHRPGDHVRVRYRPAGAGPARTIKETMVTLH